MGWADVILKEFDEEQHPRWLDLILKGGPGSGRHPGNEWGLHDNPSISATGRNIFKVGFMPHNLNVHIGRHLQQQYPGLTPEQYANKALLLIQQPVGGNIYGYKNKYGQIVRYHSVTNDFVKGHPDKGIKTMFKPADGKAYFDRKKKDEGLT